MIQRVMWKAGRVADQVMREFREGGSKYESNRKTTSPPSRNWTTLNFPMWALTTPMAPGYIRVRIPPIRYFIRNRHPVS